MGGLWTLNSQFLVAIQNNDLATVSHLLGQGVDADTKFQVGSQKRPALCICVERGNEPLASLLLESGCSVNLRDSVGVSALHLAASYGSSDLTNLLLKHRADYNALTDLGITPLHFAAQRGNLEIVNILARAGAHLDKRDKKGQAPLVLACIQGHSGVVESLIRFGANVNNDDGFGNSPLLLAASAPQINASVIQILVRANAQVKQNNEGETALHAVIRGRRSNKLPALLALISTGCDLNSPTALGHTPLHLCILEKEYELATVLIQSGCDVNTVDELGHTPIYHVAKAGQRNLAALLMASGVRIGINEDWPRNGQFQDREMCQWLAEVSAQCPKLDALCRRRLHEYLGHRALHVVNDLPLPEALKKFLSYEIL